MSYATPLVQELIVVLHYKTAGVVIEEHTEHCIMGASDPKQSKARMNDLLKVLKRYVE